MASDYNFTALELSEKYVKKRQADAYYDKAQEYRSMGDQTLARIYAQKSKDLYTEIKDLEGIPKVELLINLINEDLKVQVKTRAEFNYGKALELYGLNKFNQSLVYIKTARDLYSEIDDAQGILQCDLLVEQIDNELKVERKMTADNLYNSALSLYGFKNYTAAKQNAEAAKKIYVELGETQGVETSENLIKMIATGYYDSAKSAYVGLQYDLARRNANRAMEIFIELNDTDGMNMTEALIKQIDNPPAKGGLNMDLVNKWLPLTIVVLLAVLAYSIIRRRKRSAASKADTGLNLERELEDLI